MKSDCNIIRDLVGVYTDGAASETTEEQVTGHLAACSECREFYKIYKNADNELPAKPAVPEAPESAYDEKYLNLSNLLKRKKKIKNSSLVALAVLIGASTTLNIILIRKILKTK